MKGARLPEDWTLPAEWRNWALAQRPDLNPDKVAEEFKDYWIAKTGQNATKLNWHATWRNWVRRQKQHQEPARRAQAHVMTKPERATKEQWSQARRQAAEHMQAIKRAAKGLNN